MIKLKETKYLIESFVDGKAFVELSTNNYATLIVYICMYRCYSTQEKNQIEEEIRNRIPLGIYTIFHW